jgi:peptidyl-tRNA hydrolase
MAERYLKQVIVVNKSLTMPTGKLAAMVAHASMTWLMKRISFTENGAISQGIEARYDGVLQVSNVEHQWLTELDPGLEHLGQVSMAKIVCAADDGAHLAKIEEAAKAARLVVHGVFDSGHSHNKPGAFACIAIGPDWPENLEPVTGGLKVYR